MKTPTPVPVVAAFALAAAVLLAGCGRGASEGQTKRDESEHTPHAGAEHAAHEHDDEHVAGEDRVVLSREAIEAAGIVVAEAGPKTIRVTLDLPAEIVPNADRLAHIVPRFPGIAKEVKKSLGDAVGQGELLAVIESNESLSPYEVHSLISGTVIEKHITLGEFVRDDEDIFVVADLSAVWANITVYARDLSRIRRGQAVDLAVIGAGPRAAATIDYIGPALGETTRAATARVVLSNTALEWRPGMFATARVTIDEAAVPIAVPDGAPQRIEGREVVFVQEEDGAFVPRPVSLGRSDGEWTEVLSGLTPGERFVSRGGFLLKSELLKSEAGHEH